MTARRLHDFVNSTEQTDRGLAWELENDRVLEIKLVNEKIWTKMGSMIAYRGAIKFTREGMFEHGASRAFKELLTGEGAKLSRAEGSGRLYLADGGKKINLLDLQGESLVVNGNDLLALGVGIKWDIRMIKRLSGMLAGGLFNMHLSGTGPIAITTHHDPVTLKVTKDNPVYTDPNATVAWSGHLEPEFKTDISFKTLLGRGSGESVQMKFQGEGFVVVQPSEERSLQSTGSAR